MVGLGALVGVITVVGIGESALAPEGRFADGVVGVPL
jgi:hypothetical protein